MRVVYRSRRPAGREAAYEVAEPVKCCCGQMQRRWGRLIDFGVPGYPQTTSREVNLALTVPQANGGTVLELVPIEFCPWCGEEIEACREKR
jgi:hypothetical protein